MKPARVLRPDPQEPPDPDPRPHTGFAAIYQREIPRLIRFFQMRVGNRDDALDLAHEALTRFLGATGPKSVASPGGYITRIAFNLLKDRAKRGSTKLAAISLPLEEGLDAVAHSNPHREVEARQEADRWAVLLDHLPRETLDIFLLNRIEGYTYAELARILDIPVWRVQKHMLKALRHIQVHLDSGDV